MTDQGSSDQTPIVPVHGGLIFAKLAMMIRDVDGIVKDRKVESGPARFNFRGIDQIYNTVHEVMASHGVFPMAKVLEREHSERKVGSGAMMQVCILRMSYTLYASDGSHVTTEAIGEAMDGGDKATNKAMSYAYKYAMMQLLCIPTEVVEGDKDTYAPPNAATEVKEKADAALKQPPKNWPEPKKEPVVMLTPDEVASWMDRAKNGPVGNLDTMERELNTTHLKESRMSDADAMEIRSVILTRMVSNYKGDRLQKVMHLLPTYAKRKMITAKHAEGLIALFKSKVAEDSKSDGDSVVSGSDNSGDAQNAQG